MRSKLFAATVLALGFYTAAGHAEFLVEIDTGTTVDASAVDGKIAMDLAGSLWTLSPAGGLAQKHTDGLQPVREPRWSPDGTQVLYLQNGAAGSEIWQFTLATGETRLLLEADGYVQDVVWHPGGERLTFAAQSPDSGLDVWEVDIPTGLRWRLSDLVGDEFDPAWSADGRHLAFVHRTGEKYRLLLRRHGEPEVLLLESATPLSSPSWRPDGSLLTYFQGDGDRWVLNMAILSSPPLLRAMSNNENISPQGVSWRDRMHMVYAANGQIMTRGFADRRGRPLHFRAPVDDVPAPAPRVMANRQLEIIDAPMNALVIRGKRIFDGLSNRYREDVDILIEAGVIVAIEPQREWLDATVLDLGNVTIMPGLIDSWSALPEPLQAAGGADILAYGITTLVSPDVDQTFDATVWEGGLTPGPRLLPAALVESAIDPTENPPFYLVNVNAAEMDRSTATDIITSWHKHGIPVVANRWSTSTEIGTDVFIGADSFPGGNSSRNTGRGATMLSVLADAETPNLDTLLRSQQAVTFGHTKTPPRRISSPPELDATSLLVVAASRGNGLPTGLALHAEMKALSATGRRGVQVLHAGGRNAAQLLGLQNQIGTISPGAVADLLLVSGDPLNQVDDLLNIVAVVRNGRLFSLVRLLDSDEPAIDVE